MESIQVLFAVEYLKVNDPLKKKLLCGDQLFLQDCVLVNDPDSSDKLTEVRIIDPWENTKEHPRAFAVKIIENFPGFVTTQNFLLGVSGGPSKRSR
jgi:hypothetical protein